MIFDGKAALVTGGSRGIGRAIATMFAQNGAAVAINYLRQTAAAEATVAELQRSGANVIAIKADLRGPERVANMVTRVVVEFGGLDFVVSNAASGSNKPSMELKPSGWDWTLNINARALLLLAQSALPQFRRRGGGRIVSISSLGAIRVNENYTSVGVSKAALEALTRYLAVELAPEHVVVNCVSASTVRTEALDHFPNAEQMVAAALERTPAGRMVTAEDIAAVVRFLCSPEAEMIVGQTIVVDGGFSLPI
ncbi:MAG TPA: enoyl-[acyl-carrier-protein] reductase FabL [Actinomycetota bacterium]